MLNILRYDVAEVQKHGRNKALVSVSIIVHNILVSYDMTYTNENTWNGDSSNVYINVSNS